MADVWPEPLDAHDEPVRLLYPFSEEIPPAALASEGQQSKGFDGSLLNHGWTLTAPAEVHEQLAALYRDSAEPKKLRENRFAERRQEAASRVRQQLSQESRLKLQEALTRYAVAHQATVEQLKQLLEELEETQRLLLDNEYRT